MIQYEVTVRVRDDLRARWEDYLPGHVADVLATGCFDSAILLRGDAGEYCCRYTAATRAQLDRYLAAFAPALRADASRLFPDGVEASRAVWTHWRRFDR